MPSPLTIMTTIAIYNSCRTCLTNHTRSISCHITPLVINSLWRRHTHTNTHADNPHRINVKKPGACQPVAGVWLAHAWFKNLLYSMYIFSVCCTNMLIFLYLKTRHSWYKNFDSESLGGFWDKYCKVNFNTQYCSCSYVTYHKRFPQHYE